MIKGTVKWFDVKKGFGFLNGPDGQDVFVHFSSIEGDGFRTLKDGEAVDYDLHSGDKGDYAKNVQRSDGRQGNRKKCLAFGSPATTSPRALTDACSPSTVAT